MSYYNFFKHFKRYTSLYLLLVIILKLDREIKLFSTFQDFLILAITNFNDFF